MSDEKSEPIWPVFALIVVVFLAFNYGGMWVGILTIVIGLPIIGWSKRHEGPFPTKKLNVRPEEECMDVNSLAQQFAGRKFGELVLHHYKKHDFSAIVAALQGTIEELPQSARPSVESWIDEIGTYGVDSSFWQRDCGEVFLEICGRARQKLADHTVRATDDQLFSMFQIIVLNFAYSAHKNPHTKAFIQQSIANKGPEYEQNTNKEPDTFV